MPYKDPEVRRAKQAEYSKRHYAKNRKTVIAKSRASRQATFRIYYEYKRGLSCILCGFDHPVALDFHHVEKKPSNRHVTELVRSGHGWARILREIAKCVVLCSNCHRVHHHEEREIKRELRRRKKKKPAT